MSKKIKIGDTVVYSPTLCPLVGKVVGAFDNYITFRTEDDVILTEPIKDFCSITEEEFERFKKLSAEFLENKE